MVVGFDNPPDNRPGGFPTFAGPFDKYGNRGVRLLPRLTCISGKPTVRLRCACLGGTRLATNGNLAEIPVPENEVSRAVKLLLRAWDNVIGGNTAETLLNPFQHRRTDVYLIRWRRSRN